MTTITKALHIIALSLAVTLMAGCRASQSAVAPDASATTMTKQMSESQVLQQLTASYDQWNDVTVPIKVQLLAPQKMGMSGRMTMIRGREIRLSLRVLGMEVATGLLTPDSVYFVDKYHKRYIAQSIGKVFGHYSLTLADIQDLIMGRAFVLGKGTVADNSAVNIGRLIGMDVWQIAPKTMPEDFQYAFSVSLSQGGAPYVSRLQIEPQRHTAIDVEYASPHFAANAAEMAGKCTLSTRVKDTPVQAGLTFTPDKAKWNQGLEPQPWQPLDADYRQLDTGKLVDILKQSF